MSTASPALIEVSFQLTFAELYKASVAISLRTFRSSGTLAFFLVALILGGAGFALFANKSDHEAGLVEGIIWALLFTPLFLSYVYFVKPYFLVRTLYKSDPNLGGRFQYSFSENQVTQQDNGPK